jgi:hypothetical protein
VTLLGLACACSGTSAGSPASPADAEDPGSPGPARLDAKAPGPAPNATDAAPTSPPDAIIPSPDLLPRDTAAPAPTPDAGGTDIAGGPAPGGDPAPFIGVWEHEAGSTERLDCPGKPSQNGELEASTLTFRAGTDSALVMTSPGCNVKFALAQANMAQALPDQTCPSLLNNRPATFAITSFRFTIQGTKAMQMSLWTITQTSAAGGTTTCTLDARGTLFKRP